MGLCFGGGDEDAGAGGRRLVMVALDKWSVHSRAEYVSVVVIVIAFMILESLNRADSI